MSRNAYRLTLPSTMKIHPVFHVNLLEPHTPNTIPNRTSEPPPPVEIEGELEYEVADILDSKIDHRRKDNFGLLYKIHWQGYDSEHDGWLPAANLENAQELLDAFHTRYPSKPGPVSTLRESRKVPSGSRLRNPPK